MEVRKTLSRDCNVVGSLFQMLGAEIEGARLSGVVLFWVQKAAVR